ncbi:PREDICTED: uncharacterized protein LOC104801759 [Tarenaya hassleriana]|uniref:uncharacterized protein LOC104801759 n=1 Tax=Tarenaya hassleriana TaxID=28532 RepID=UPI00053C4AEB|nr:PREDICTED: uncharacterized protein LOC104801759 [Tarenaya hassleriana]
MEMLSRMLDKEAASNLIKLHPRCSNPTITHLSFADDVMIFSSADTGSLTEIMRILCGFGELSGLHMNKTKTEIYIDGVVDHEKTNIAALLGLCLGALSVRHLGVPLSSSRLTKQEYMPLIDKLQSKLENWASKCLSYVGKRKLTAYAPNSFGKIPRHAKLARGLHGKQFTYQRKKGESVAWTRLNIFKERGFWDTKTTTSSSWNLRKLLSMKDKARSFIKMQVRDGQSTQFWLDDWTPHGPLIDHIEELRPRLLRLSRHSKVAAAVANGGWSLPTART